MDAGIEYNEKYCILDPDASPYGDVDWIAERVSGLEEIPDAFVCANDFLAVHLMNALKKLGLSIPGDVRVAGFDGTPHLQKEHGIVTYEYISSRILFLFRAVPITMNTP